MHRAFNNPLLAGFLLGMLLTPAFARETAKPAKPPQGAARPQNAQPRANNNNHPGEQILTRLSQMTPEEREQALSRLPPAQRANIEKRIQNFQKLPPAVQARRLDRLERLNSLPPKEQNQVRRSMRQLNELPQDRRKAINQELGRMTRMPEDERGAYINTPEFRDRYSPEDRQMIGNLSKILPAPN